MEKTEEEIKAEKLKKEKNKGKDIPNSGETENNDREEDINISKIVDELMPSYPNVTRGIIYEATMSINNEVFLANYLSEQNSLNSYTERDLTIGDLFLKNDPSELNAVLDLGGKIGLSKSMTIMAAGFLGIGKTVYNIVTNDDIRKKLDDIDLSHSKKLIEKANALTGKVEEKDKQSEDVNKNKEGK